MRILVCALIAACAGTWSLGALHVAHRMLPDVSVSAPGAPPRVSGEPDQTEVDPQTWRVVSLRMLDDRHPGNYYEMELLQPAGWIARNNAAAGRWIDLSLPELQISGMAQVTGIGQCPAIESGYGRVVLGTFTSVSSDVYELKLAGQDEAIGVTSGHPIWSLDRGDWIAAGALRPGERLATAAGAAVVESVTAQRGERRVYNLDVEADHRYLVTDLGVTAHNITVCGGRVSDWYSQKPSWVTNANRFMGWLVGLVRGNRGNRLSVTAAEADLLVADAQRYNVYVRLDPPHPNTDWNVPHLNFGDSANVHVEVPVGYTNANVPTGSP